MKGKRFTSKGIQCVPQYFIQRQLRTNVFLEENCSKESLTTILKGDVLCWLEFQTPSVVHAAKQAEMSADFLHQKIVLQC